MQFPYQWNLKDNYPAKGIDSHHKTVFTTFACGGGSSMGYKLAGYDVIGANDIDPQMEMIYRKNHSPKLFYRCPINELLKMDLPQELYDLDVLDGSPPCSTFSMAGNREKNWKKKKKFREGQATQELSDLFFDFIKLANKLKPKVIVAENVKGMLLGNAKAYTKTIINEFEKMGYKCQLFLLNAATMGVPQRRERVFFICHKRDKKIYLEFDEKPILFKTIDEGDVKSENKIANCDLPYWALTPQGKSIAFVHPKKNRFNSLKISLNRVCNTIASGSEIYHPQYERGLTNKEMILVWSFPLDYDFANIKPKYLIGMSVPPIMMAQVAYQVYLQLLK